MVSSVSGLGTNCLTADNTEDKTMQEFIHNIAALFKVKTIISLVCIFVFAYLAIKQIITPDNVMTIVSMVIAFYFGTQAGKDK